MSEVKMNLITSEDTVELPHYSFEDMLIGQDSVAKKLSFYVNSHSRSTPFPTMLFSGSQGLGKTHTSRLVADALDRELVEVNCDTIVTPKDFFEKVIFQNVSGNGCKTVLLDESHQLSKEIGTILLSILNPTNDYTNIITYQNMDVVFDLRKINVIFATTDAHRMLKPLINRCKEVYFSLYSLNDLYKILRLYLNGVVIDSSCDLTEIAYACRGRARNAFLLAQDIRRYCKMNRTNVLTNFGWQQITNVLDIYNMGLNKQEVDLLNCIANEAPISCKNIALKFGVTEENIQNEWEIRLRELGFIATSSKGRELTDLGMQYVVKIRSGLWA